MGYVSSSGAFFVFICYGHTFKLRLIPKSCSNSSKEWQNKKQHLRIYLRCNVFIYLH